MIVHHLLHIAMYCNSSIFREQKIKISLQREKFLAYFRLSVVLVYHLAIAQRMSAP